MAVTGKQEKTKYKLAESVKECMKTAPVDKITVKNIAVSYTHLTLPTKLEV